MSTVFSAVPPVNDRDNALIDMIWEGQGVNNAAAEADFWTRAVSRASPALQGSQFSSNIFQALTGGAVTINGDAASGIRFVQITSGAGTRTIRLMVSSLNINSGAQYGLGNVPAGVRRNRRYRAGGLIRVPVRGTAVLEFGLAFSNGFLSFLGTSPGYVLSSDPGVNGGLWTPRVRLTDGGGITTDASTGRAVNTATFDLIEVQYTEGLTPLIELLINGVTVASRSGLANVPGATASNTSGSFGFGASIVAGTTMQIAAARYRIEEL